MCREEKQNPWELRDPKVPPVHMENRIQRKNNEK